MTDNELKTIANSLSDAMLVNEKEFADRITNMIQHTKMTRRDGYVIGKLAQLYYNIKLAQNQGQSIDRDNAIAEQTMVFAEAYEL